MGHYYKLLGIILFSLCLNLSGQSSNKIYLKTVKEQRSPSKEKDLNSITNKTSKKKYGIIQFNSVPNQTKKNLLSLSGIELLNYIPDFAYYVSFNPESEIDFKQKATLGITDFLWLEGNHKIDPLLADTLFLPEWIIVGNNIEVLVHFFSNSNSNPYGILNGIGNVINKEGDNLYLVSTSKSNLNSISNLNVVRYIEPASAPFDVEEFPAMTNQRGNYLKTGGLNYDGTGVTVYVGDGGTVSEHLDYEGRMTLVSSVSESDHATHVAGIVGGAGNYDPSVQGQATGATILSRNGSGVLNTSVLTSTYNNDQTRITSHSLGWGCNGGYNSQAVIADQQTLTLASVIHVFSAGNSGNDDCGQYPTGWGNITGGYKQAKNVLAVANLSDFDVVSGSSSRGPSSDGRIKPDIAAVGSSVNSTQAGNTYGSKSGTSMACPAVSGVLAQLYHAYRDNNVGADPKSGLIKAILLNSADDIGNVGPDFKHGWGRINARKAYEIIKNKQYITSSISNNQNKQHNIAIPNGTKQVKVMVYWTDLAGVSGTSKSLVNDIDMYVNDASNTRHNPYILAISETNAATLDLPATKGADHLNNMEQVVIDNPTGTITVNLNGFVITNSSQEYFIVYEFIKDEIVVTFPKGGEKLVPSENTVIRWDAIGNTGTFDIEYSSNNGVSWETVTTGVTGSRRYYTWSTPSTVTKDAKIRVKRSSITGVSESSFTVIDVPQNLNFKWSCQNKVLLEWDAVNNATSYTIYEMGNKYMDSIGVTTSTSFIANSLSSSSKYFSVAANYQGKAGRRTIAQLKSSGSFGICPDGADLVVDEIISPTASGCFYGNSQVVQVRVINAGLDVINSYEITYKLGANATISQTINNALEPGKSVVIDFTTPFTVPNSGTQNLVVTGILSGETNTANNQKTVSLNFNTTALSLPLSQNFDGLSDCSTASDCEATVCNMSTWITNLANGSVDDIDWRVDANGTPTTDSGPSGDNTSGNGKYAYLESSTCYGKLAVMETGCINVDSPSEMTFYYNFNGINIDKLEVDINSSDPSGSGIAWSKGGNLGDVWNKATVDLTNYVGQAIKIQFKGYTGTSFRGDIAIDDINIESKELDELIIQTNTDNLSLCDTLTISATGPITNNTYNWDFGLNAVPSSATGAGPHKVYYTTNGSKTINVTGDNNLATTKNINVVSNSVTPSVSISATNGSLPLCSEDDFEFTASGNNLGSNPTYTWWVNGIEQASTTNEFTISNPSNNDVVLVEVLVDASCVTSNVVIDSTIINVQNGISHQMYISTTSYNNSGTWTLKNSSNQTIASQANGYSTDGDFEVIEFCLTDDCYDFTFADAFKGGSCNEPAWVPQVYPIAGTRVSHQGNLFESKWYVNTGDEPNPNLSGGATPWQLIGPCAQTIDTDVFGIKATDGSNNYFEVTVANYTSPNTQNFCVGNGNTVISDFSVNKTSGNNCNDVFTFTANITGNATSYNWNFGNNATPSSANGVGPHDVTYDMSGSKTIALTVNDTATETKTNFVTITDVKVTPTVAINTQSSIWCEGDDYVIGISSTNGGSAPQYSIYKNNALLTQTTLDSVVLSNLMLNDSIYIELNSDVSCATSNIALSNKINIEEINCIITSANGILNNSINVYPNPTSNDVFVSFNQDDFNGLNYRLTDITGKLISTGIVNSNDNKISLLNQNRGVYLLTLSNQNQTWTFKIIKN